MRSVSCLFSVLLFVRYGDKAGGSLFNWIDITIEIFALDSCALLAEGYGKDMVILGSQPCSDSLT